MDVLIIFILTQNKAEINKQKARLAACFPFRSCVSDFTGQMKPDEMYRIFTCS